MPRCLTRNQVREVDRLAIERYHIPGIVLMENASRAATEVALDMLCKLGGDNVLIVCGGGNNGGDGLAMARHLHNAGADVQIMLTIDPVKYTGDALINWRIVEAMQISGTGSVPNSGATGRGTPRPAPPFGTGLRVRRPVAPRLTHDPIPWTPATPEAIRASRANLIVDAIFGTGLSQPPRDPFPVIAGAINENGAPILAIDLPSGLDCDTARPLGACIRATRTITFVAPKAGFGNPESKAYTGEVTTGSIGCPKGLIDEVTSV